MPISRPVVRPCEASLFEPRWRSVTLFGLERDLTPEAAIGDGEIDRDERHADEPPDEPDSKTVLPGGGALHREGPFRTGDRGQHIGIDAERGAPEHSHEIGRGG